MEQVVYKARDGYEIPAFLTVPVGSQKESLPFVIYPHGGPWSHDKWGFDNYVQFMASKGYGVLQPQFRGSTGLGIEHEEAGYGQWSYTIQDDITDGVQWLIDEGIADPDRICIMGGWFCSKVYKGRQYRTFLAALQKLYTLLLYKEAKRYVGLTLDWD